MKKQWIVAGIMGGIVLVVWMSVVNGVLGFQARIDMKRIPGERQVYEMLKERIVESGRYTCNPELTAEGRFPDGQPVFSVLYGGVGHEAAGRLMLVGLVVFFAASLIAAWMLSRASDRVLSSYPRRVLFITAIGVLLALVADLQEFGIGGYPPRDAVLLALNRVVSWTLVGLVVAWRIKPERAR